jgi:cytidyltransferase-like protein
MKKISIVSGYFNPVHIGHLNLFRQAKEIGNFLIVILNNDKQTKLKTGLVFMPEAERAEIIKAIKYVDEVFVSIDEDRTVIKSLEQIFKKYPNCDFVFANGGDRGEENIPEAEICKKLGIKIVDGVGGEKVQSSSWLLKNIKNKI